MATSLKAVHGVTNYAGTTESTSKASDHQEGSQMQGGHNQENTETRTYNVKKLLHFIDSDDELPKEPLLKCIMRMTNLGAIALVLNAAG